MANIIGIDGMSTVEDVASAIHGLLLDDGEVTVVAKGQQETENFWAAVAAVNIRLGNVHELAVTAQGAGPTLPGDSRNPGMATYQVTLKVKP